MNWMTPLARLTIGSVLALALSTPASVSSEDLAQAAAVAVIVAGPDFELLGLDGERHHLADARGKVLLVNFWATWCTACRSEIPDLNHLYNELSADGVVIYGISTDVEGAEKVVPYVEKMGVDYPILLDPEAKSPAIFGGLEGYPMTYIFDREGLIYSSYLGAQVDGIFRADIEYLLRAEASEPAPLTLDGSH